MDDVWVMLAIGTFAGGLVGSLVEYWVHILMHRRVILSRTHFNHHREPEGENVLKQFAYYFLGGIGPASLVAFGCYWFGVLPAGLGFLAGAIAWAAWVAYAHTLQHERPELVFWMKRPVHHLHHEFGMGHHNFGLSVDWWDHVFRTYKPMPFERGAVRFSLRELLRVRWY